ncbi:short chain dehydrogenase [Popillia japonica]|uniref:15-hydroxyprostaglandin dehydrogenase [NAD(+)] n=1 Tax=Popillia japonica TaxID=7064 RepID=A0AAW1IBM3_POPJA
MVLYFNLFLELTGKIVESLDYNGYLFEAKFADHLKKKFCDSVNSKINVAAMNFSDKVALVTGGAGGIGKGCVEELLENGIKGVTIADINSTAGEATTKEFNQKYGLNKVLFVKTDVTNTNH